MKKTTIVMTSVLALMGVTGCSLQAQKQESPMQEFQGTYVGFAPTDESAVVSGEFEMTISYPTVTARMATGHKIQQEELDVSGFVPMSSEEVAANYRAGSPFAERTIGFKSPEGFPQFLFIKNPADGEFGLVLRTGGMGEILGPTVLYSPAQVASGVFENAVSTLETNFGRKGVLPRLRNDGKAEGG